LEPLTLIDTAEYIRTRLRIAGLPNQEIFSDSCIAKIYRYSGGIPRLVNTICDNALVSGFACDSKTIEIEIIDEVIGDLRLAPVLKPDFSMELARVDEILQQNPFGPGPRKVGKS
jgi:general secretion pathway protein A